MNHLIIVAHPSTDSFSHQSADALVERGRKLGWNVVVRDLYAIGFDPVLSPSDMDMMRSGSTPRDIAYEQKLISDADIVTFLYPMWWTGFPAIMKGYIDRVLSWGFAYKNENGKVVGLLKDKKVFLFTSMGNDIARYEENNLLEAFKKIHSDEIFGFCGMEVVGQQFFSQITSATKEQTDDYLRQIGQYYRQFEYVACGCSC